MTLNPKATRISYARKTLTEALVEAYQDNVHPDRVQTGCLTGVHHWKPVEEYEWDRVQRLRKERNALMKGGRRKLSLYQLFKEEGNA